MDAMAKLRSDPRIVLTLDAGGTTLRFFATQGGRAIAELPPVPTRGDDLEACLATLRDGFAAVAARCPAPPCALSFAFPGPADYPAGVVGDLPNLPAFRGGVALGPMLAERFQRPVFLNNDGALFAYGEALAGFLPDANRQLERSASPRRYSTLLGITLGTGFGGGVARAGELLVGDNSSAGQVFLLRNKLNPALPAEHGVSIAAVRRVYAELASLPPDNAPDPKAIAAIARGEQPGHVDAARESFRRLGEIAGDAIAQALTVIDGLVVIGGGLARASDLILPALVAAMNASFQLPGAPWRRLIPEAFNFEDPAQRTAFCRGEVRTLAIPGSTRTITHDRSARVAVGLTRLGTSEAIALGAYAFALRQLDAEK